MALLLADEWAGLAMALELAMALALELALVMALGGRCSWAAAGDIIFAPHCAA